MMLDYFRERQKVGDGERVFTCTTLEAEFTRPYNV